MIKKKVRLIKNIIYWVVLFKNYRSNIKFIQHLNWYELLSFKLIFFISKFYTNIFHK